MSLLSVQPSPQRSHDGFDSHRLEDNKESYLSLAWNEEGATRFTIPEQVQHILLFGFDPECCQRCICAIADGTSKGEDTYRENYHFLSYIQQLCCRLLLFQKQPRKGHIPAQRLPRSCRVEDGGHVHSVYSPSCKGCYPQAISATRKCSMHYCGHVSFRDGN